MGHYWEPGTPKPSPDVMALIEDYAEDNPYEVPDWARQLSGGKWQTKRRKEVYEVLDSDAEPKERVPPWRADEPKERGPQWRDDEPKAMGASCTILQLQFPFP